MPMSNEWIVGDIATEGSRYSLINIANLKERKAQNDLDGLPTHGYGRTGEANYNHLARQNNAGTQCIAIDYDENALGYLTESQVRTLLALPPWQQDIEDN